MRIGDVLLVLCDVADEFDQRRLGPMQVLEDEHERPLARQQLQNAPDPPVQLGLHDLGRGVRAARSRRDAEDVRRRGRHRAELVEVVLADRLEQVAELGGICSGLSLCRIPAAPLRISETAQYVMPSPYGRQRPQTARPQLSTCEPTSLAAGSCRSRVRRQLSPCPAAAGAGLPPTARAASPARRRDRRACPGGSRGASGTSFASLATQTRTGSDFPLASTGSASSYSIACFVASCVSTPTTIPLIGAAPWIRAAVLITSPAASPISSPGFEPDHDDRVTRVDAGTNVEVEPVVARVQLLDRLRDRERRANGAFGIVLVRDRRAEQRDDRVADELRHRPAMQFELAARRDVIRSEPRTHVLGI